MKKTGITRAIDEVGRIVLPKELRATMDLNTKDELDISVEGDRIILKKIQPSCIFCGNGEKLVEFKGSKLCRGCIAEIAKLNN